MHNVVSVDGFIADENDEVGLLFEWYGNGDTPLDGGAMVSQASADYKRPPLAEIGTLIVGVTSSTSRTGGEASPRRASPPWSW